MDYKLLFEVSVYRKDRISSDMVDKENYISTENMLPNRGGVEIATTVASAKTFPAYKKGDILLSNIRPYFKKIWYADKEGGCSNDVLVVKGNKTVDNKFLYYVLSDNNFFNYSTVTSIVSIQLNDKDVDQVDNGEVGIVTDIELEKGYEIFVKIE